MPEWNEQAPVDTFERNRNATIYNKYQHNRNPFIDHQEWASSIWQ
ncbi:endonuclease [Peribacillus butanolivorans]